MLLEAKTRLCQYVPLNLLIRGGDHWSSNVGDAKRAEAFQSMVVRRALGKKMSLVKEEEVTNKDIRRILGSVPKAEEVRRGRQILLAMRIERAQPASA